MISIGDEGAVEGYRRPARTRVDESVGRSKDDRWREGEHGTEERKLINRTRTGVVVGSWSGGTRRQCLRENERERRT